jgi:hypothetical protein
MSWWRRKPKPPQVDYLACIQEAGILRDRIRTLTRLAQDEAAVGNHSALPGIKAQVTEAYERMLEIEREVTAR